MPINELITGGLSATVVAVVFMFKIYLDRKKVPGQLETVEEIKKLRREMHAKERRDEMKPLADALTHLTVAVKELHASHQMQVKILEGVSNRLQMNT